MNARIRRHVHFAVADLVYYSGAFVFWRFFRRRLLRKQEVCVLGLHRVLTKAEQSRSNSLDGMVLNDVTFVKLLRYLQREFHVVSLEVLLNGELQKVANAKPWCVLTFDDGWADTYRTAYPKLKQFGMPAVVYLATGSIGSRRGVWVEQLKKTWNVPSGRARMSTVFGRVPEISQAQSIDLESTIEWLKRMPAEKRDSLLRQLLPLEENGDGQD